jgi:hypothetical protein
MRPLPPYFLRRASLFWSVDPATIDVDEHADWLIGHVLEHGNMDDTRALLALFGEERVARFFRNGRGVALPRLIENFWRLYFRLTEAECTNTSYPRRRSGFSPR